MRALLAVLITSLLASTQVQAACKISVLADLALEADASRLLVKGAVNGEPAMFILDTGAWASAMPFSDAHRLGVRLDTSSYFNTEGIGGDTNNIGGYLNMKLGKLDLPHEAMTVMNMRPLDHNAVALIGREVLGRNDLEIDLPNNEMRIERVFACQAVDLAYWAKSYSQVRLDPDGSPHSATLFTVLLNGRPVTAQLDSGATQSIVTPGAAMTAGIDLAVAKNDGDIQGIGHNRMSSKVATFNTFTIGDETIKNAKLVVAEMWHYNKLDETGTRLGSHSHDRAEPEMLLGADFLRSHHVLIANSMGLMVFSYVGGPVFDISERREAAPAASPEHKPAS